MHELHSPTITHKQSFSVASQTMQMEKEATMLTPHFNQPSSNKHRDRSYHEKHARETFRSSDNVHGAQLHMQLTSSMANDSVKAINRAREVVSSEVPKLQALVPQLEGY